MVKVSFKPYEELVMHEHQEFNLGDMIRLRCTGMQAGSIAPNFQWADGLLLWPWVSYSEMPEFRPSITFKETSVTIPIINVSDNPVFSSAAKWLKERG